MEGTNSCPSNRVRQCCSVLHKDSEQNVFVMSRFPSEMDGTDALYFVLDQENLSFLFVAGFANVDEQSSYPSHALR